MAHTSISFQRGVRVLSMRGKAVGFLLLTLVVSGCMSPKSPDLKQLYDRSAQYHGIDRNPVIVIPGVLGSKLVDRETGRVAWGAYSRNAIRPSDPDDMRMIALPLTDDPDRVAWSARLQPNGTLDRIRFSLIGLPIEIGAYANILAMLGAGGYQRAPSDAIDYGEDHFTCFEFPYDWRLSNVENAERFHRFIEHQRAYVQQEHERRTGIKDVEVRFDIVAHSMGGLLARYFLRYGAADLPEDGALPELTWAGANYVEKLIMVGPPNAGSVVGLDHLLHGMHMITQARYPPAILGTFPSLYELLPRTRHGVLRDTEHPDQALDIMDPAIWEELQWGLADPKQDRALQTLLPELGTEAERRVVALEHMAQQLKHAEQFHAALDVPAEPPAHVELSLVAGDAIPTEAIIHVDLDKKTIVRYIKESGDGKTTRQSALLDERMGGEWGPRVVTPIDWNDVMFLFASHIGMTRDPAFIDNVLFRLLEEPNGVMSVPPQE